MPGERHISLEDIDQCLPQTQCTECDFPSCADYAKALHERRTDINRCPPGGDVTITALAQLIDRPDVNLASDCKPFTGRLTAVVREADCIGCTLCIAPCPTDAIIGAAKHMHSVLQQNCTGCGLCVSHCPVDCIDLIEYHLKTPGQRWPHFDDHEVSYWKTLAKRRKLRLDSSDEPPAPAANSSELRRHIREAVNRERTRRWKKQKRSSAQILPSK